MTWIGRNVPQLEDPVLIRGEGRFVADIAIGSRSVRFIRSSVASGRIVGIEHPATLPANTFVVTAVDLSGVRPIVPRLRRFNYIPIEQPILPTERVHYVGQAFAAVVADTAKRTGLPAAWAPSLHG